MASVMSVTPEDVAAGQAVYTPRLLHVYDLLVLGISNRFIWRCPTPRLLALYNRHVTANHLDVGVGTGYFLDRCRFPTSLPRIALMDLNPHSLEFAARRIARYRPETYQRNVLEPIARFSLLSPGGRGAGGEGDVTEVECATSTPATVNSPSSGLRPPSPSRGEGKTEEPLAAFDSVGINYLLHCLPGTMESKSAVFDNLRPLMNPGAVWFGSTLLQGGVPRNWAARRLMAFYNDKGVFTNTQDSLDALGRELQRRFRDVTIEVAGCAALFAVKNVIA